MCETITISGRKYNIIVPDNWKYDIIIISKLYIVVYHLILMKFCYKDGAFTVDCTMEEMIELSVKHMRGFYEI